MTELIITMSFIIINLLQILELKSLRYLCTGLGLTIYNLTFDIQVSKLARRNNRTKNLIFIIVVLHNKINHNKKKLRKIIKEKKIQSTFIINWMI